MNERPGLSLLFAVLVDASAGWHGVKIPAATAQQLDALRPSAQSPATLGIQVYAGVSITGAVGMVYAIQATTNVAGTNGWTCLALVQLPATNYVWVDTSKSATTGQRFYRAVVSATNLV